MMTNPRKPLSDKGAFEEYQQRLQEVIDNPSLQVHEKLITMLGIADEYTVYGVSDLQGVGTNRKEQHDNN